jgi:uncharacterized protein YceK
MRLAPLLLMLTSILISGCASHSVDCAMGAGHNGCTPGTKEYEQMVEQQQAAKSGVEIDDAICRTYGAEPGSTAYAECRRKRIEDRQMFEPPRTPQTGSVAK